MSRESFLRLARETEGTIQRSKGQILKTPNIHILSFTLREGILSREHKGAIPVRVLQR